MATQRRYGISADRITVWPRTRGRGGPIAPVRENILRRVLVLALTKQALRSTRAVQSFAGGGEARMVWIRSVAATVGADQPRIVSFGRWTVALPASALMKALL